MTDNSSVDILKDALRAIPSLAATATGNAPNISDIYYPENHASALDPDVSLVVGNRGMGKSFWANALLDSETRKEIAHRYLGARARALAMVDATFGFASGEGAVGSVSRDDLRTIPLDIPSEDIWRGVLIKIFAPKLSMDIPARFRDLVLWVNENPQDHRQFFRAMDNKMSDGDVKQLVLFDQLEQLAPGWERIQDLTKGLLQTCLAMKSYRSIRLKIFMRTDQFEDKSIFDFRDAAKIKGEAALLRWSPPDLYGLLFSHLEKDISSKAVLHDMLSEMGENPTRMNSRLHLPSVLVGNTVVQADLFDKIAGSAMGGGKKRGRPYSWISTHLADGRGEISPRTFLLTIRAAAYYDYSTEIETAIDYRGIQEGVRAASENRLDELLEDYPWVSEALAPLRGLIVPCEKEQIISPWAIDGTIKKIITNYKDVRAPLDLVFGDLLGNSDKELADSLLKILGEIGVVEIRTNGKINLPDIFRVQAGILRRGGVTPQQRRGL